MQRNGFETKSVWQDTARTLLANRPPREQCEVCVIGAGIAGLTAAWLLRREGRDVELIDAFEIGAGESGRTTAHLTAVLDDRFVRLTKLFGVEGAQLAAQSHAAAIDTIERTVRDCQIHCDFERVDGVLFASNAEQADLLGQEAKAATEAGFREITAIDTRAIAGLRLGAPALRFPRQAMFHVGKYLQGLARAFVERGGHIATGVKAVAVEQGDTIRVVLDSGREIRARHVIVATNTPFIDRVTMHTKQAAYRTYVVGFAMPARSFPAVLLWDLDDPYHYVRVVRNVEGGDVLLVGGEDHKTGQDDNPAQRFLRLTDWARNRFDGLRDVRFRWSGQVMEPVDGLGFIGPNPGDENIYVVTGDSGNGMTHGTLGGMIISDMIAARKNPWAELYDPARKTLQAARSFIDENANVVGHLVKDWITRSDISERDAIRMGSGAIVRDGLGLLAVYRDNDGRFHELSAACTHLGCVVQWNDVEKSWDCPCHGSRFGPDGVVLNGPASKPLERQEPADTEDIPTQTAAVVHRIVTAEP